MARSKELEEKIIELYNSGLSMAAVGREVGKASTVVFTVLNKYNIPKRTKGGIYKLPAEEIIDKYVNQKRTLESIRKDYGVTINTVKKVLLDNNCSIRNSSESKNPHFNQNFFEKIDNEAAAYYLGFMITDGCVLEPDISNNHPNYKMKLELQDQDKYILEQLKEQLRLTSANLYQAKRIKNNSISITNSLGWFSTKMANDLAKYGVVPRKTSTVYLPKISKDMMPHLIRGLIDGDGCITITHSNGLPRLAISFCGNETLVTQLRDYLVKELKIHNAVIEHIQPNLWQISWGGKNDCLKICEYIYQDATFYLTRKKDKYLKMSKYYDNTEVI